MKTMGLKVIGNLLITVHGEENMTEEEAQACFEALKGMNIRSIRALVYTKGGGPTPAQRKALADKYRGREVPTAILAEGRFIRGVVTAMSWFNPSIRAFPMDGFDDALKYLDVPQGERKPIEREIRKMIWELDPPSMRRATVT